MAEKDNQLLGKATDSIMKRNTPIMGWASWNNYKTNISEGIMKAQIDAMVSTGLKDCGYEYFNMDDGYFGGRDEDGVLKIHPERFPNGVKVIADYAHKKGLKAGIYSEAGDNTCAYYYDNEGDNGVGVGLYGYEEQDLRLFLMDWEFDFIKVDWCGGLRMGLDEQTQYTKIGDIIKKIRKETGRYIVYNVCRWQFPGEWVVDVADSWRTGTDISVNFNSVLNQIDNIKPLVKYCGPGHVNDLDMMQVGNGMSYEEDKSHFSMWCMLSTPLIIGCDMTKISEEVLSILKNKEMIAINQDPACIQGMVAKTFTSENGELVGEVWVKDLGMKNSQEKAVAFLNRSDRDLEMAISWDEIGFKGENIKIRDLWEHEDVEAGTSYTAVIPAHGIVVLKVSGEVVDQNISGMDNLHNELSPSLDDSSSDEAVTMLSSKEFDEMLGNGATLLDVRTAEEYASYHLKDAINIPYTDIHTKAGELLPDKNRDIIVYCTKGKRCIQAKTILNYLDYTNVYTYLISDKE